jgi:hypothetical protein
MGYIVVIVFAVFFLPLLFFMLSRKSKSAAGIEHRVGDHGVSPNAPSSDQPTPSSNPVNKISPSGARRVPPG